MTQEFARAAGYFRKDALGKENADVELICCYRDMTGRDLTQRRT